jgi:hypothetical protein
LFYDSTAHKVGYRDNSAYRKLLSDAVTLDLIALAAADVSLNSHKLTNVTDPTSAQDAATKNYVDTAINGLAWKESVRVATTAAGTLASSFENGDTVDGVVLATGNRILIKNQAAGAENGIYTVNASGAPTRALDADSTTDIESAVVMVEEGTTNAGTSWLMTTDNVTIGSTSQTWSQFGNGSLPTDGAALLYTGSVLDVITDNSSIEVNADALRVKALGITNAMLAGSIDLTAKVTGNLPVGNGGTGSNTAAGARTNLGATTKVSADITGDNSTTAFGITHNLGTKDVLVQVWEFTTDQEVFVEKVRTSTNVVTINFAVAPATSKVYRVVIIA